MLKRKLTHWHSETLGCYDQHRNELLVYPERMPSGLIWWPAAARCCMTSSTHDSKTCRLCARRNPNANFRKLDCLGAHNGDEKMCVSSLRTKNDVTIEISQYHFWARNPSISDRLKSYSKRIIIGTLYRNLRTWGLVLSMAARRVLLNTFQTFSNSTSRSISHIPALGLHGTRISLESCQQRTSCGTAGGHESSWEASGKSWWVYN